MRTVLLCLLSLLIPADVRAVRQSAIRMNRRAALDTALLLPLATTIRASAAEPEPAVSLTDEEMAARIARKQELLKRQSLKGKADAKVVYGADYVKGVRSEKSSDFKPDTTPNLRSDTFRKASGR